MRRAGAASFVWFVLLGPVGAAAQTPTESPPGPYVVDVRVGISGLPKDAMFFPPAPSGTLIPSSGLGADVGGHVYLLGIGPARVGIGASVLRAAGRQTQAATGGGSGSTTAVAKPDVDVRVTTVAPQISFNFGTSDGWSYISLGAGPANIRTTVAAFGSGSGSEAETLTPETSLDSSSRALNFGGGARWFMKRRLAFSFDVRFHVVSAGSGDTPTPRTTLIAASAGISLR